MAGHGNITGNSNRLLQGNIRSCPVNNDIIEIQCRTTAYSGRRGATTCKRYSATTWSKGTVISEATIIENQLSGSIGNQLSAGSNKKALGRKKTGKKKRHTNKKCKRFFTKDIFHLIDGIHLHM